MDIKELKTLVLVRKTDALRMREQATRHEDKAQAMLEAAELFIRDCMEIVKQGSEGITLKDYLIYAHGEENYEIMHLAHTKDFASMFRLTYDCLIEQGFTHEELGHYLDRSRSSISQYRNGNRQNGWVLTRLILLEHIWFGFGY